MNTIYLAHIETNRASGFMVVSAENGEMAIHAFRTQQEGLDFFESAYKRKHKMGYEASMSAVINWMQFSPAIVAIDGDRLPEYLPEPPYDLVTVANISGRMKLTPTADNDLVRNAIENGVRPAITFEEL